MQLDDEIGKLSATVPPVVSRALELFVMQLMTTAYNLTTSRNSKTILPIYLKEAIESEEVFAFLKPLVAHIATEETVDGKSKPRNGTGGRKRKSEENQSVHSVSDEPGRSNGKRKYTRRKTSDAIPEVDVVEDC
nr:dr1 associated corepressor [Hymenolepis microstoma]